MNSFYYSLDSGTTWEGPFTQIEINNLRAAGIIDSNTLLREEPVAQQPPPIYQTAPQAQTQFQDTYIVMVNGIPQGPYSIPVLMQMLQSSMLRLSDMAWKEGMTGWQPLSAVLPRSATQEIKPNLDNFSLGAFFSEIFKRHSAEEMYDCFIAGTRQGTPPLQTVSSTFPAPWIFTRFIIFSLILYFGFNWALNHYHNTNLVPGLLFVGNFGIPFCIFFLFFELNVRRDVPLYKGLQALIAGGLLSLIITCFINSNINLNEAFWAGPIEETAKLIAAVLIANQFRNGRILTGLLIGAAVGAGFAAFESAGYTFNHLIALIKNTTAAQVVQKIDPSMAQDIVKNSSQYNPDLVMQLRALLTPFAHVVWTAITAGAYWMAVNNHILEGRRKQNDTSIDFNAFTDKRFLIIAIVPVILHMIWNSYLFAGLGMIKYLILGIIAWIFALRLVGAGISQVSHEKNQQNI